MYLFLLSVIFLVAFDVRADFDSPYWWISVNKEGGRTLQTLSKDRTACPQIKFDDETVSAEPVEHSDIKLHKCYIDISSSVKSISVDGENLELNTFDAVKNILIIGDSGCRGQRLRGGQSCHDQWHFAKVVEAATLHNIDLIIHMGDVVYNIEKGSNIKDHRKLDLISIAWEDDFFKPASALLHKAPWLFIRGNHDGCSAVAGKGWSYFIENFIGESLQCIDDPQILRFGNVELVNVDSAEASDLHVNKAYVAKMADFFISSGLCIDKRRNNPRLLLTHRPPWGLHSGILKINSTLREVLNDHHDCFDIALSGHSHMFRAMRFQDGKLPQVIVGNGGGSLDLNLLSDSDLLGIRIGKRIIKNIHTFVNYGYAILDIDDNKNIKITAYDMTGRIVRVHYFNFF